MPEPEFEIALRVSIEEHMVRRANAAANLEVMRLGRFRWKYRFYWGRYVALAGTRIWYDYETGVRITRQGALVAAARHLTKLQTRYSRTWERETGRP